MSNVAYPQTFADLQAELQRYCEDDTTEYTSDLENIIARAEDAVARDLDLEIFKTVESEVLTISDPDFTTPDGAILVRWMFIPSTGTFIEKRTMEFCKMYGGTGTPKYYAENEEDQLYLAPTPDQAYAVDVAILRRPEPLADANQENWLTENVPDLLLWRCLIESEQYLIDEPGEPRIETFRKNYADGLASAKVRFAGRERMDTVVRGAPPPAQPAA